MAAGESIRFCRGGAFEVSDTTRFVNDACRTEQPCTVTDFDPQRRMKVVGKAGVFTSIDEIEVIATDDGTVAVYDAELKLRFPLSLGDRFLAKTFNKIGDKAAGGMEKALDGTLVS